MLRRSSSMSHIPLAKRDNSRSRSSVRSSSNTAVKDAPPAPPGKPSLKRSISSSALKKSSLFTPTLQPGTSYHRRGTSTSTTPASARSRSRSPYKFGSTTKERTINDKKWVAEQHSKVYNFFLLRPGLVDVHVIENFNPPSIGAFVQVINILLKRLDPKTNVTQTNYKEVVMSKMKMLRYPGSISNSTLKTVYTAHSWPHVICMLGWLVDLVTLTETAQSSPVDDNTNHQSYDCILSYFVKKYTAFNTNTNTPEESQKIDKSFQEELEKIYNIDNDEIKRLKQKVAELSDGNERQLLKIRNINNENDELKKDIESKKYEIDTFHVNNDDRHVDIDHVNRTLKEKIIERTEALKKKQANIKQLEEAQQKQPCSFDEKKKLQRRIDELKHTMDLKKESLAAKKQVKEEWDIKLAELRKKIQTEVFRLNDELIKYTIIYPDLKILEIRETNYASSDFKDELEKVLSNKKRLEEEIRVEIKANKARLTQLKEENVKIGQEIDNMRQEIDVLIKQEAKLDQEIQEFNTKMELKKEAYKRERNDILRKINEMTESEPDIDSLTTRLNELVALKTQKHQALEKYMHEKFDFLQKLYDEVMRHFKCIMEIANRVVATVESRAEQVYTEETEILNELEKLLPFGTLEPLED